MPGVDPAQLLARRVDDQVSSVAIWLSSASVQSSRLSCSTTRAGVVALERVGAQRAAQPPDHRRRREALAGHVAHHQPDARRSAIGITSYQSPPTSASDAAGR